MVSRQSFTLTHLLTELFLELVVVCVRDIRGNVIRTLLSLPLTMERVPSLGKLADDFLDSFGFLQSTILALEHAYIESHVVELDAYLHFVQCMAEYGIAQREASVLYTLFQSAGPLEELKYRYRPSLEAQ